MLSTLLSKLAAGKGGAVAAAALAVAVTFAGSAGVGYARESLTLSNEEPAATCTGKPEVVAQRNDAAKILRDGYHDSKMALVSLRGGGKDVDHQAVNDAVKAADEALRDRLTTALDDVAALTLGRNGHEDADTSDTEETSDTDEDTDEDADEDTDTDEASDSEEGRPCDVPAPAADQAALDSIVETALSDMQQIVTDATDSLGTDTEVAPTQHGNSGDHGKPDGVGPSGTHGKSGDHKP